MSQETAYTAGVHAAKVRIAFAEILHINIYMYIYIYIYIYMRARARVCVAAHAALHFVFEAFSMQAAPHTMKV